MEETRGKVQKILSEDEAGLSFILRIMVMLVLQKREKMGNTTPNSNWAKPVIIQSEIFSSHFSTMFLMSGSSNRILYFEQHRLILIF